MTAILAWPGYRVYRHEINEAEKTLTYGCGVSRSIADLSAADAAGDCTRFMMFGNG
jgi:hypothetical protein